jgi:hypothetical protein
MTTFQHIVSYSLNILRTDIHCKWNRNYQNSATAEQKTLADEWPSENNKPSVSYYYRWRVTNSMEQIPSSEANSSSSSPEIPGILWNLKFF